MFAINSTVGVDAAQNEVLSGLEKDLSFLICVHMDAKNTRQHHTFILVISNFHFISMCLMWFVAINVRDESRPFASHCL